MRTSLLCLAAFFFIQGLHAQTNCQWAYIPVGASAYNNLTFSAVDLQGNHIQAGKIMGIADMDPGTGPTDTAYTFPGYNYFLSKTTNSGHLLWIRYFQIKAGVGFFEFKGIQVNSNNEILVLGNFYGAVDFDLSPAGVDTLRSHFPTYPDYFVGKYDASGNLIWVFNIGSVTSSNIESQAFTVLPNNDILVAANPTGAAVDVDPGPAVHNSISGNGNLVCYNNNGNYLWNNNCAALTYGVSTKSVDVDANRNAYFLTVSYYELTVNKFSSTGARVWNKKIGNFSTGARVNPLSVLVDKTNGSFYVAGTFGGSVDFDPGAATVIRSASSASYQDGFIARYDSSMNLLWVNQFAGNLEFGKNSLDVSGNQFVAVGRMKGNINMGNGLVFNSPTNFNAFYLKFNDAGVTLNGYLLSGYSFYNTINSIGNTAYVVTGAVNAVTDMDPNAAVLNLTPGTSTAFTAMYGTVAPVVSTLDLKVYLQGYYAGAGVMHATLANQGVGSSATVTDSVIIELHEATVPYALVRTVNTILNTNGNVLCTFTPALAGNYYLVVKHRNGLTTWSAAPVSFGTATTHYDFTTAASQAYGNNQLEMESGKWAMYSGDINHDENIDLLDASIQEGDINQFLYGYTATDLNGDGNVDLLDVPVMEANVNLFVYSAHP